MRLKLGRIFLPPFRFAERPGRTSGVLTAPGEGTALHNGKSRLLAAFGVFPPLSTDNPGAGSSQDPPSSQTGRLAHDCAPRNRAVLTGGGRRIRFSVKGGNAPVLRTYRAARRTGGRVRCCGVMPLSMLLPIILLMSWILSRACFLSTVVQPS